MDAIHGLTVNSTAGFQLSLEDGWIQLDGPSERLALQVATINLVSYQRERFPVFLLLMVVSLVLAGLAAQEPRPAYGDYELADWPWWALGAALAFGLYLGVQSASVVIASGTTRTILRGSSEVMTRTFNVLRISL